MRPVAVTSLPDLLYVFRRLFFVALFFLLGFVHLIGRVPYLLHPVIDLAQFHLRRIIWRNDLRDCLLHLLFLSDKVFQVPVPLQSNLLPISVLVFPRNRVVDKIHPRLQFVGRRHVVFDLECGYVVRFHPYDVVGPLFRFGARRQILPAPVQRKRDGGAATVGF